MADMNLPKALRFFGRFAAETEEQARLRRCKEREAAADRIEQLEAELADARAAVPAQAGAVEVVTLGWRLDGMGNAGFTDDPKVAAVWRSAPNTTVTELVAKAAAQPPAQGEHSAGVVVDQALVDEYLSTLDDESPDEWYCTARELAEGEVAQFKAWLEKRPVAAAHKAQQEDK